jgi:hypothetical protein
MNRKIFIVLLVSFVITVPAFADSILPDLLIPDFSFLGYFSVVVEEETQIPEGLRNNHYFLESLRLSQLAMETFEFGDYDASSGFAEEAIRFAIQSNEFVAEHLIAEAERLLGWADSNNIQERFTNDYNTGKNYFETSVIAYANNEWDSAINDAVRSIQIFTMLQTGGTPVLPSQDSVLPSQYTVRTWVNERDCLWNIAAYPWVYGDPWRWRDLYNANRSRMPDPNNPNLIEPGFVLDIPSIRGETRQGMWSPDRTYR